MADSSSIGNYLQQIKQIHALAETGLAFSPEVFDQQRYEAISAICQQILAQLSNTPLQQIHDLVTPDHKRYVTPQVEVRGAVFWLNKVLLVKEKHDGLWALPGGYADVGLTPVENIEKEIFEESGVRVDCSRLYGLRHKASGPYDLDIRDFYKLQFVCDVHNVDNLQTSIETSDVGFFDPCKLPPLSRGRTIERDIEDAQAFIQSQGARIFLD